jgi:hypothetical protein
MEAILGNYALYVLKGGTLNGGTKLGLLDPKTIFNIINAVLFQCSMHLNAKLCGPLKVASKGWRSIIGTVTLKALAPEQKKDWKKDRKKGGEKEEESVKFSASQSQIDSPKWKMMVG